MPAKPKAKVKKPRSPVDLQWGTFCRIALEQREADNVENSLIGVLPSLILTAEIEEFPEGRAFMNAPVGPLVAFAVFRRRPGIVGPFRVEFDLDMNFCGQKFAAKAFLDFSDENNFGQLAMRLMMPGLPIPAKEGKQELMCSVGCSALGEFLGTIEMPVTITTTTIEKRKK